MAIGVKPFNSVTNEYQFPWESVSGKVAKQQHCSRKVHHKNEVTPTTYNGGSANHSEDDEIVLAIGQDKCSWAERAAAPSESSSSTSSSEDEG